MTERQPFPNDDDNAFAGTLRCSVAEAARLLGLSETTVRRRIKSGALPAMHDGERWVVLLPAVLAQPEAHDVSSLAQAPEQPRDWVEEPSEAAALTDVGSAPPYGAAAANIASPPGQAPDEYVPPNTVTDKDDTNSAAEPVTSRRRLLAIGALAIPIVLVLLFALNALRSNGAPGTTASGSTTPTPSNAASLVPGVAVWATESTTANPTLVWKERANGEPSASAAVTSGPGPTQAPPETGTMEPPATAAPQATATAEPTATQPSAEAALQAVSHAEASVRTGWLEATMDMGQGARATAEVRFDIGTKTDPPRLYMKSIYHSETGQHHFERVAIGDREWQRQNDGAWQELVNREGVWGQVQPFLPRMTSAPTPSHRLSTYGWEFRWYDQARDADITLWVDPNSGEPRMMRQVRRSTGSTLSVTYKGWNTPVQIPTPTR